MVWSLTTYALPRVALWAMGDVGRSVMLVGSLMGMWVALRMWRLARSRQLRGFEYEAREPLATTTIDLSSAGVS
jgi:hypothetical protein